MDISLILSIIGALAWLPFIIDKIQDWLTKAELSIITDKSIEIGFTFYGPIANIILAFTSDNDDALINKITLVIEHENNERHEFEWQWFEENILEMHIPNAGSVPYKKNQRAIALKVLVDSIVEKKIGFQKIDYRYESNKLLTSLNEIRDNLLKENQSIITLKTRKEYIELENLIRDSFIWKRGMYKLTIKVFTTECDKAFEKIIKFNISSFDLNNLQKNQEKVSEAFQNAYFDQDPEYKSNWNWIYPTIEEIL